ncbi:hypothetical protein [Nocardia bovistercoris]|uniref:Uncharacterized protein n=1 Tax=Nocardia bovistercoris TaxID=2785916 RepID=A0A931IAI8_9NOCA|nr:hypothetical protein [Nocardia bovistercoris]MBH0776895.1 hypothetical protein [Nocardia bovistercoris]
MDTVREVAEEGKRLIDRAWLGELTREEAVHRFVQVGDGLVCAVTAGEIIDDGVRWLDTNAARLRVLAWCAVLEIPLFGGFAVLAYILDDYSTCALSVGLLLALQVLHRKLLPHPVPRRRW